MNSENGHTLYCRLITRFRDWRGRMSVIDNSDKARMGRFDAKACPCLQQFGDPAAAISTGSFDELSV